MKELPRDPLEASLSIFSRLFGSPDGLAQASHAAAGMSLTEGTASRVISDDAIKKFGPVPSCDQPSRMVANATKIVHRAREFKVGAADQVPGRNSSNIIWSA